MNTICDLPFSPKSPLFIDASNRDLSTQTRSCYAFTNDNELRVK